MGSCPIEIFDVGTQDTMQLLLMEDQHVVKALSPDTPQKAFTDRIGPWCMIGNCEYLDAAPDLDDEEGEERAEEEVIPNPVKHYVFA